MTPFTGDPRQPATFFKCVCQGFRGYSLDGRGIPGPRRNRKALAGALISVRTLFLDRPHNILSGFKYLLKLIELVRVHRTGELKFESVIVEANIVGVGQRRGETAITASLGPRGIMILNVTVRLVMFKNLGELPLFGFVNSVQTTL
jgi:hypothetical protein